jgi:uncharacterized protein YfeS
LQKDIEMSDHNPFNEPEVAHARARELMVEPFFWDCINEFAPFGSDEGFDAYYEWRRWREENPSRTLKDCLSWVLVDQLAGYTDTLYSDERIERDLTNPKGAFLVDHYDMFTLDTTIIASALGQLLDEGTIDADTKAYVYVAINRQLHPKVCKHDERHEMLMAVKRVVDAA